MTNRIKERILVVDDERAIRTYLRIALSSHGYDVIEAESAFAGVEAAREHEPDVILLDMGLPDASGLEVTKYLRGRSWTPIIFISVRDDEQTKVQALDAGADDFLTKPFGLDELLARVRAVLRRQRGGPEQRLLSCGSIAMDQQEWLVTCNGERVALTPTEFQILKVLLTHCGKLVSHREILVAVWGPAYADEAQILRVNIFNLRKKLTRCGCSIRLQNEAGVGYRLTEDELPERQVARATRSPE